MTKIDIISGFLGAGKTTLIKKLLGEALSGEKVVLIENEFGEIGIDGGFLKDSGIQITEMNSGCICCSLVGDFEKSLAEVLDKFSPDRVIIEPSGVGKLSDIIHAVEKIDRDNISLNSFSTVVDAKKCKMYLKNFGEFFCNQVENARAIILSRSQDASEEKLAETIELLRGLNSEANIITTPWDALDGKQILHAMETAKLLSKELEEEHEKAHHHHEHGEECHCHDHEHHHDHDEECHCHEHEHHHHEHGEECHCHEHEHDEHEHEHHHDHNEECHCHEHEHDHHHHEHGEECHCHEHGHHHHHDADEVFASVGFETIKKYTLEEIQAILKELGNTETYGFILRSKGIVPAADGWIHFDYVPEESNVRMGSAETIGKICVIGSGIDETKIKALFRV
ncbi:MAG: GTP-binding protein [Clostridia bacterium]|nr:GTP-binding protein [Clostridia bacterium]